jgi:hypothetical protein
LREFLARPLVVKANTGSFDFGVAPLREATPALRMTGGWILREEEIKRKKSNKGETHERTVLGFDGGGGFSGAWCD